MDGYFSQRRSLPALICEGREIAYGTLEELTRKSPPARPFVATQTLECVVRLLSHFRTGTPAFPFSPHLPEKCRPREMPRCPGDLFLFTSGSTGGPKIGVLTVDNFIASAEGANEALSLAEGDRWLLSLPLYHVGGIAILFRCLLAGAAIVLSDGRNGITHLSYVPTQLFRLKENSYPNLKCLLLGGAPCPKELLKRHGHLPLVTSYGMTEMASLITCSSHKGPLPHREIKIDEKGEIFVRGKTLFKGYWREGLHLPLTEDGWFASDDLGQWENESICVLGRKDNLFISGGENIHPEEIEGALLSIPEVVQAIVVPREDHEWGERPVAYVKTTRPLSLEEVCERLTPLLPRFKHPVALLPLPEDQGLKPSRLTLANSTRALPAGELLSTSA